MSGLVILRPTKEKVPSNINKTRAMKRPGDRPIDCQASLYNIFLLTIFTYHSKVAMSCGWSWWGISFTRPSWMWMTWSAIGARVALWVTIKTVDPCFLLMSWRICITARPVSKSSAPVGSSPDGKVLVLFITYMYAIF